MNRLGASVATSLAVYAFFAPGCDSGSGGRGSETHWLATCASDSTCGGGLKCLCGTCTLPCSATPDCRPLGDTAACASAVAASEVCQASTGPAPRMCLQRCSAPADCTIGTACVEGTCVPRAAREAGANGITDAGPDRGGSRSATTTIDGASGGANGGTGPAGEGGSRPDLDGGGAAITTDAGLPTTSGDIVIRRTKDQCATDPTQFQPLVAAPGETCYEFPVHGVSSPTDKSKFTIPTGQSYNQFYYGIPWPAGTLATRFGARFENLSVLRHWFAFGISSGEQPAGNVQWNVTGTTLGQNAELIGGWAVGDCNVTLPNDVGLKLPDSGQIMIQWDHDNGTGSPVPDGSVIQFCTVPAGARPNVGGLTFLGTENFKGLSGMQAGEMGNFSGTCQNDSGKPITIVGYNPQMHPLGTNMRAVVTHTSGVSETVFDHPFSFDHQVSYLLNPGYVLQPGDKITSTCTFDNTTAEYVPFSSGEMCSQLVFAYPYGALQNGVISLLGATNTCW